MNGFRTRVDVAGFLGIRGAKVEAGERDDTGADFNRAFVGLIRTGPDLRVRGGGRRRHEQYDSNDGAPGTAHYAPFGCTLISMLLVPPPFGTTTTRS